MIKSDRYEDFKNHILNGDICIFETDTVVGIGCLVTSEKLPKIYKIKNRPLEKKLPVLVNNIEHIKQYTTHNIEKGSTTYIVNTGNTTTAFRAPNIQIPNALIACTSANISGEASVADIKDVNEKLIKECDFVYTKKIESRGKPSRIIDLTGPSPKIIR